MGMLKKSGWKRTAAIALGCLAVSAPAALVTDMALAQDNRFTKASLRGTYKVCMITAGANGPTNSEKNCVWQSFDGEGGQRLSFFTKSLSGETDADGETLNTLVGDAQGSMGWVSGTYRVFSFGGLVYESVSASYPNETASQTKLPDNITITSLDCAFFGMVTRSHPDAGFPVADEYLVFGRNFAWAANPTAPTWRGTRISMGVSFPGSAGAKSGSAQVPR